MVVVVAGYIASSIAGAVASIRLNEPARFGGLDLHGSSVTTDFLVGGGTALSGPLVVLVGLAAVVAVAMTQHRYSEVARYLLAATGVGLVVAQLGEPYALEVLSAPNADRTAAAIVAVNVALPIAMSATALTARRKTAR